jgi:hypothetical protein
MRTRQHMIPHTLRRPRNQTIRPGKQPFPSMNAPTTGRGLYCIHGVLPFGGTLHLWRLGRQPLHRSSCFVHPSLLMLAAAAAVVIGFGARAHFPGSGGGILRAAVGLRCGCGRRLHRVSRVFECVTAARFDFASTTSDLPRLFDAYEIQQTGDWCPEMRSPGLWTRHTTHAQIQGRSSLFKYRATKTRPFPCTSTSCAL